MNCPGCESKMIESVSNPSVHRFACGTAAWLHGKEWFLVESVDCLHSQVRHESAERARA